MQPFPIFIITGGAGSGKDTVAEMMCQGRNGQMIAQADPMKRFAQEAFGFTSDQLWGPSSSRNAPDERYAGMKEDAYWGSVNFQAVVDRVFNDDPDGLSLADRWLMDITGSQDEDMIADMRVSLNTWLNTVERAAVKAGVLTPRTVLQLLGTEFGRSLDPNIWSNYAIRKARQLLVGGFSYGRERGLYEDKLNKGANFVVITDGRFRNEILNVKAIAGQAWQVVNPDDLRDTKVVDAAGIKGHISEAEMKGIPRTWLDEVVVNDKALGLGYLKGRINEMMWQQTMDTYVAVKKEQS